MTSPTKKQIRVGLLSRPRTLDPRETFDLVSAFVVSQIFETPYAPPKDGERAARPALFEGPLTTLSSGEMYAGRVRAGSRFSDGTPLTAGLVAASLQQVTEVTARATIEARGDLVVFSLKEKNPRFDLVLTQTHAGIAIGEGDARLGTGPFMLERGSNLDRVRLVRNPHARVAADIDEIEFVVYPPDKDGRPRALLKALGNGEVDFTSMLSRNDAASVQGMRKRFQPSNSTAMLYLNCERAPLNDVRVRRGLVRAIDRVAVAAVSYSNALAFTATSLLPPSMAQSRDGIPFAPDGARALLAEAGVTRAALRLVVVWAPRPYLPNPQPTAAFIAEQLAPFGFDVEIVSPANVDDFLETVDRADYDLLLSGWIADTPDPADFLEVNLRSDRIPSPRARSASAVNRGRLRDRAMDEALQRFRQGPTDANRDAVVALSGELCPLLALVHGPNIVVHAFRLHDLEVSAEGVPWFHTAKLA